MTLFPYCLGISIFENSRSLLQHDNSNKVCFGRKTKFFRESEDFPGNQETWEIFRETWGNKVKISGSFRFFVNVSHIVGTMLHIFGKTFYGTAQTAFVRVVTPGSRYKVLYMKKCKRFVFKSHALTETRKENNQFLKSQMIGWPVGYSHACMN